MAFDDRPGPTVLKPGFTEPEPPKPTTVTAPVGAGEAAAAPATQAGVDIEGLPEAPRGPSPRPSGITAVGKLEPGLTAKEELIDQQSRQNIFEANRARAVAELEAMGASEAYLNAYADLGEADAIEARRLHQEHFSQAKKRMDELYREVDDARALRVNPYNWHESIGRGGRVAAAFAMMTGQMAAGAGNPNSAIKILDAAIERDIAAQEQNIKNQFEALRMRGELSVQERALYEEELNSLNKTRALAYAAIQGRISAAMQHATTEGHYQSLNVMQDHYNLKLLENIKNHRASILSLHVNRPIEASQARAVQRQITMLQEQLRPGTPLPAETTAPTVPTADTGAVPPTAPGRAGSVAARRGPPGVQVDVGDVQVGEAALGPPPAPSGEVEVGEITVGEPTEPSPPTEELTRDQVNSLLREWNATPYVIQHDGYGKAKAAEVGYPDPTITGINEAYQSVIRGGEIPNDGFADERDARAFAALMARRPPRRENYQTQAEYEEALNYHKFNAKRFEVYEQEGIRNTISAGGRTFRIKYGKPARTNEKRYIEVADKLAETQEFIRDLAETAENYRRVGPTGGFFNAAEGMFSIPGLNSTDPGTKELAKQTLQLAMGFIKANDPTARLSDQDVIIGKEAMGNFFKGKYALLDIVQSFDDKYDNNTVRRSVEKYMQVLAKKAQVKTFQKFENELVPDYNTAVQIAKEAGDLQLWLNENFEE